MSRLRYAAMVAALAAALTGCGDDPNTRAAAATSSPSPVETSESPTPSPTPVEVTESPTPPPPAPAPTPAWTPCNVELLPDVEGACSSDFFGDTCDAAHYSYKLNGPWGLFDAYVENMMFVNANRLKDCPQYLPTYRKALTGISEGSMQVGTEVKPGTYETTAHHLGGKVTDCYWERATAGGRTLANDFITAATKVRVTIRRSDGMFTSRGCGNWAKVS